MNPEEEPAEPIYHNGYLFSGLSRRQANNFEAGPSRVLDSAEFISYPTLPAYGASAFPVYSGYSNPNPISQDVTRNERKRGKQTVINKRWSSSETRVLISCYQEHVEALKKAKSPQTKKAIWEAMFDQFQETCQEHGIESGKSLAQLKEKWKSLFDKYKAINDNNKATGRGRLTFEFFEEMDSFLGFSDKVNPKFVSETVISNENADEEPSSSSRSATPNSGSNDEARDSADDNSGPVNAAAPKEKATAPKKKRKAEEKHPEDAGPSKKKTEKRRKSDEQESMLSLLQNQQEMMAKSEEKDRLAMQELMKFEMEAEKRHQEFTLAALKELGNIFNKTK